jgi:aryl-alcohol dehydrogenase-like predicted oxidoreductase
MEQIDASLTRLATDYVDLYQIHRFDSATPVAETMEALHDTVKAGKVRYLCIIDARLAVRQAAACRRPGRLDQVRVHSPTATTGRPGTKASSKS